MLHAESEEKCFILHGPDLVIQYWLHCIIMHVPELVREAPWSIHTLSKENDYSTSWTHRVASLWQEDDNIVHSPLSRIRRFSSMSTVVVVVNKTVCRVIFFIISLFLLPSPIFLFSCWFGVLSFWFCCCIKSVRKFVGKWWNSSGLPEFS